MVTGNGYTQSTSQLDPSPVEEDPRAKCYGACFDMNVDTAICWQLVGYQLGSAQLFFPLAVFLDGATVRCLEKTHHWLR